MAYPSPFRRPGNNGRTTQVGKTPQDSHGYGEEPSDADEAGNHPRRRNDYVSSGHLWPKEAATVPEDFPRSGPPQDPLDICEQCLTGGKFCDQAQPQCNTCFKQGLVCSFQDDQDSNPDCDRCLRDGLGCDQAKPQCENCQRSKRTCKYNGEPLVPSRKLPRGQDPATKCEYCAEHNFRCDSNTPCGTCVKHEEESCQGPQGGKPKKAKGVPPKDRCWRCRTQSRTCNGAEPCNRCVRDGRECFKNERPPPEPPVQKCIGCRTQRITCDGGAPCSRCVQKGRAACKYEDEDGAVEWHFQTDSEPKEVLEDCIGCVRFERSHVHAPKKPRCDRQTPCNNCRESSKAKNCFYQFDSKILMVIPKKEGT